MTIATGVNMERNINVYMIKLKYLIYNVVIYFNKFI